jgi:hypothetical protein
MPNEIGRIDDLGDSMNPIGVKARSRIGAFATVEAILVTISGPPSGIEAAKIAVLFLA